jgi:hypothetical protein
MPGRLSPQCLSGHLRCDTDHQSQAIQAFGGHYGDPLWLPLFAQSDVAIRITLVAAVKHGTLSPEPL